MNAPTPPVPRRVVVTGGRHYRGREHLRRILNGVQITHLAHGGCPTGADALADEWANDHSIPVTQYWANWLKEGPAAGPKRNRSMLDTFKPYLVVAFPGGKGTADCVAAARKRGIVVMRVGEGE